MLLDKLLVKLTTFNSYRGATLSQICNLLLDLFSDDLTDDEKDVITGCREIRNKFLHCFFTEAAQNLSKYFGGQIEDCMWAAYIPPDGSPFETIDILHKMTSNNLGDVGISLSEIGNVYGNVLNLNCDTNYNAYKFALLSGWKVIDKLMKVWDIREVSTSITEDGYWYVIRKFFNESKKSDVSNRWKDAYDRIQLLLCNGELSMQAYTKLIGIKIDLPKKEKF